jgi:predicted membrane-bound spermidine synthase
VIEIPAPPEPQPSAPLDRLRAGRLSLPLYAAVGCVAGALIALQISVMRIFSEGSWAHFGSLVISLAMLGFGLTSAVMSVARRWFDRHWAGAIAGALVAFPILVVASNLTAQQLPFNPIFLVSDATQKWRLVANFVLYLLPFLAGCLFLGTVLLRAQAVFGRVYFADLVGSGLCGLVTLGALFAVPSKDMVLVPVALGGLGGALWFIGFHKRGAAIAMVVVAAVAGVAHVVVPSAWHLSTLAVSEYKGVSYARAFPDSQREYDAESPFGHLEVYSSSYLHFAPGLSDNASLNIASMPANAYLGLYIDGDGPIGVMRDLTDAESKYFLYLPMIYPYLVTKAPKVFVVQFGGGLSTMVALHAKGSSVTVAESNPAMLAAFRKDDVLKRFTSDVLGRVSVIPYDGRLYLAKTNERYDVVDLSLADSAGLSNPGGFAIVEKYSYTQEAMAHYMRALTDQGVLSVTLWNKEEPPKSVLRLYAAMAGAARVNGDTDISRHFFVAASYLSTTTVLYKRSGFTADDLATLRKHTTAMSFDEIYSPGIVVDVAKDAQVFDDFRQSVFATDATPAGDVSPDKPGASAPATPVQDVVPATRLFRMAWQYLLHDDWTTFGQKYLFDVRPITNTRPYFAAYVFPRDLPRILDRLELFQDEWGYLLIWVTLAIATVAGAIVIAIPVVAGWRTAFSRYPGKAQTILYFACLGLGYITVEVGLTAVFTQTLSNATVSASVLITGMLVSSGLGSLVSERYAHRAEVTLPKIAAAIGVMLIVYSLGLNTVLAAIGGWPYLVRLVCCFVLIAPPAFLMGFPMATGMGVLTRLKKEGMFLWAWGVNGCFSVVGAALVPIVATAFGLTAVIATAGAAYLLAIPAFFGLLKPPRLT